ncbi:hypothetical protein [Streptomyces sp. NBC_00388]|uniref:hypothetical protein n=1 Tax=Streptomyces sp. NBC_00388 TaxID=2975735 RepID=UPI002E1E023B
MHSRDAMADLLSQAGTLLQQRPPATLNMLHDLQTQPSQEVADILWTRPEL